VGNTYNATLTVIAPPSISKAFSPSTIPLNGTTDLSFTITNPNTTIALTGLQFTDVLPAGLLITGVSAFTGGSGTASGLTALSFSAATLAPAGVCTLSASVQGTTAGVKNNTILAGIFSDNGGRAMLRQPLLPSWRWRRPSRRLSEGRRCL
jgi:uncharacterized repeat protein (TIGR01451 family)